MVEGFCQQSTKPSDLLTLTENASTIVKSITDQGGPETSGLRITEDPAQGLAVTTAASAEPGDQTVELDGAVVYLDAPASQALDNQILDAAIDAAGRVEFGLAPLPRLAP
jgi:Fe-S cluster assembly iron-binding protein IscA